MPIELKICGINSKNIIQTIIQEGGCQYLGFVFYPPSPRNLSIEKSKKLTSIVPNHIKKVAVLVKPENSFVKKIIDQFDYLQIYETSPSRSKALKIISNKKIIGPDLLIFTPGIRMNKDNKDDQQRVCTPMESIKNGSDKIIMGRSLMKGNIEENLNQVAASIKI